jgi:hypothetical protein
VCMVLTPKRKLIEQEGQGGGLGPVVCTRVPQTPYSQAAVRPAASGCNRTTVTPVTATVQWAASTVLLTRQAPCRHK